MSEAYIPLKGPHSTFLKGSLGEHSSSLLLIFSFTLSHGSDIKEVEWHPISANMESIKIREFICLETKAHPYFSLTSRRRQLDITGINSFELF